MDQHNQPIIKITSLRKSYAGQIAVDGLSLDLAPGSMNILLGANGAGKSTALRLVCGLLKKDQGEITFANGAEDFRKTLGFLGHENMLYQALTVGENLEFYSRLRRLSTDIKHSLELWNLTSHRDKRIHELSKGLKQRAAMACALVHAPRYIFLDEPTANLDDASATILLGELRRLIETSSGFALIATHDLERFYGTADRVLVMQSGRVVCDSERDGQDKETAVQYYRRVNC